MGTTDHLRSYALDQRHRHSKKTRIALGLFQVATTGLRIFALFFSDKKSRPTVKSRILLGFTIIPNPPLYASVINDIGSIEDQRYKIGIHQRSTKFLFWN